MEGFEAEILFQESVVLYMYASKELGKAYLNFELIVY